MPKYWQVSAFMHSVLDVGSASNDDFCQTISNTFALLDANEPVLRLLLTTFGESADNEENDVQEDTQLVYSVMLESIANVWGSSPRIFEILVTGLMNRTLLPPDKLLKWLGSTQAAFINDFNHISLILIASAINSIPRYVSKSSRESAVVYLGDCTTAALDPLIVKSCLKYEAMQRASEEEEDDATIEMKEMVDQVRCVVRHSLSMRAVDTSSCMLDPSTATSVLARVLTDETPPPIKQTIQLLSQTTPLY